MSESTNSSPALDPVAKARRGLLVYFLVLVIGSGVCEGLLIATREAITDHLLLVLANMWMPTLASVVARVVLSEGIVDVSFRFGPARRILPALGKAWGYPLVVGGIAYGIAWTTGLASFVAPSMQHLGVAAAPPWLRFAVAAGYVAAHLRFTSGSVWPAIAFHSAWNSIIQGAFDGATAGASSARTTSIWIGESGILVVVVSVVVAVLFVRGPWGMRRWPTSPVVVPVVRP